MEWVSKQVAIRIKHIRVRSRERIGYKTKG